MNNLFVPDEVKNLERLLEKPRLNLEGDVLVFSTDYAFYYVEGLDFEAPMYLSTGKTLIFDLFYHEGKLLVADTGKDQIYDYFTGDVLVEDIDPIGVDSYQGDLVYSSLCTLYKYPNEKLAEWGKGRITCMQEFGGDLYYGCEDGHIFRCPQDIVVKRDGPVIDLFVNDNRLWDSVANKGVTTTLSSASAVLEGSTCSGFCNFDGDLVTRRDKHIYNITKTTHNKYTGLKIRNIELVPRDVIRWFL